MPYEIKKFDTGYKVCKENTDECYSKKPLPLERAKRQQAAIGISEAKGGAVPSDPTLYEKAKKIVDKQYKGRHSAYRSGALVKKYKDMGGTYEDDGEEKTLSRWFKEQWKDVGNKEYPVFRPTKRITKKTPLLPSEIDPENLKEQIKTKQKIKGTRNLKPFKAKGGDLWEPLDNLLGDGIMANSQFYRTDPKRRGAGFFDDLREALNPTPKEQKPKTFAEQLADIMKSGDPFNPTQEQRENLAKTGVNNLIDYGSDLLQNYLLGNGKKEDIKAAGSAETNERIAEIQDTPMGNEDISRYFPDARYIKYSDLKNYSSITDLLPKNGSFFFLLYEHRPNTGHWVLLTRYDNKIEYFDSYGLEPSKPLTWNRPEINARLGQDRPYLNALFDASALPVIVNRKQFQSKKNGSATCGAWDVFRQLSIKDGKSSLAQFQDKIDELRKKTGLSGDEIVSNLISKR